MAKRNKQIELEKRRLRAGRLLLKGVPQVEVAQRRGVAKSTVSGWAKRVAAGGLDALRSERGLGRPEGLDAGQRAELARALKEGAMAHGFATELWTLPRVGRLIEARFGRRYSEPHVWRLLRQLGFTPQRPSKRASERDEATIRTWKRQRWPALKKTPKNKGARSSSSTNRDWVSGRRARAPGRRAGRRRCCSITSIGTSSRRWPGSHGGASTSGCFRAR